MNGSVRRGRPPCKTKNQNLKQRSGTCAVDGQDSDGDKDATMTASKSLEHKLTRKKRKPRRLAEDGVTQNLCPRTWQVI